MVAEPRFQCPTVGALVPGTAEGSETLLAQLNWVSPLGRTSRSEGECYGPGARLVDKAFAKPIDKRVFSEGPGRAPYRGAAALEKRKGGLSIGL